MWLGGLARKVTVVKLRLFWIERWGFVSVWWGQGGLRGCRGEYLPNSGQERLRVFASLVLQIKVNRSILLYRCFEP